MAEPWHVLVVDDEEDVHLVTNMALKRRQWQGRRFQIHSARSAEEARQLLLNPNRPRFEVALVDVVMETPLAGLELCGFIRANAERSLRIILRTGQPGVMPEERVLTDYDIDYYLAKAEATEHTLYTTMRACVRASQEITTLMALGDQMRSVVSALQASGKHESLTQALARSLAVLERKYAVRIALVFQQKDPASSAEGKDPAADATTPNEQVTAAAQKAHAASLPFWTLHSAANFGLTSKDYLMLPEPVVKKDKYGADSDLPVPVDTRGNWLTRFVQQVFEGEKHDAITEVDEMAFYVQLENESVSQALLDALGRDLSLLADNWIVGYRMFRLQEQILEQRLLKQRALDLAARTPHLRM